MRERFDAAKPTNLCSLVSHTRSTTLRKSLLDLHAVINDQHHCRLLSPMLVTSTLAVRRWRAGPFAEVVSGQPRKF